MQDAINQKKIAILATGANGCCIAADLTTSDLDVVLIDQWAEHVDKMQRTGLSIITNEESYNIKVRAYHLGDVCTIKDKFDIVFLTSKAYDSRWLTEFIKPYLAKDGLLIAVQNCMTAEMIGKIVGVERTLGCVVELSSQLFQPGEVKRNTLKENTWFGLGSFDISHTKRLPEVQQILSYSGKVDLTDDILSAKWMKLIVNAMTMAIKAILGMTNEEVFHLNGNEYAQKVQRLFIKAGEEALTAGQVMGYKLVPIFGLEADEVKNTNNLLETLLDKIVTDVGPTAVNTVLQDHIKGRYSEVDMINGIVAEESYSKNKAAPVSEMLVDLTHQIYSGELKQSKDNLQLMYKNLNL